MGFLPDRDRVVVRHILERQAVERPEKECAFFESGERWTFKEALEIPTGQPTNWPKSVLKREIMSAFFT